MNIKARINARKIIITYFYEKIIFSQLAQKDSILSEILAIDNQFHFQKELPEEKALFSEMIKTYYHDVDSHIDYLIAQFFTTAVEEGIDKEYIEKVAPLFDEYLPTTATLVNTYTTSFEFDRMDTIDQCVFILGVIEYQTFKTPKEILINEMVELAKRYGDGGTSRLVNAILHKIIAHQQEQSVTPSVVEQSSTPKKPSSKKTKKLVAPSLFDSTS